MRSDVTDEYPRSDTDACFSVLLLVADLLKKRGDAFRIIGGWVPKLLCKQNELLGPHTGSLDVDILLRAESFAKLAYEGLPKDLKGAGLEPESNDDGANQWYARKVVGEVDVRVDFLAPRQRREDPEDVRIGGLNVWKAYGTSAALGPAVELSQDGTAWKIGQISGVRIPVAAGGAVILAKAISFDDRRAKSDENKPYKDAYDLVYLITSYRDGPVRLAEEVAACEPTLRDEALRLLEENFRDAGSIGPRYAAYFLRDTTGDRSGMARYVSEQVMGFIGLVGSGFPLGNPRQCPRAR